jgi:hypothetical protein
MKVRVVWQRPDPEDATRTITKLSRELTKEEALALEAKLDENLCIHRRAKKPSFASLEKWSMDGICPTPDGCRVEPDGTCEHGWNSWLLILGVI